MIAEAPAPERYDAYALAGSRPPGEDATYVTYAWWLEDSRMYWRCKAVLTGAARPAAAAFAKACEAVAIERIVKRRR